MVRLKKGGVSDGELTVNALQDVDISDIPIQMSIATVVEPSAGARFDPSAISTCVEYTQILCETCREVMRLTTYFRIISGYPSVHIPWNVEYFKAFDRQT